MTSEHAIWLLIGLGVGYLLWKDGKIRTPGGLGPGGGKPTILPGEVIPSMYGAASAHSCSSCGGH